MKKPIISLISAIAKDRGIGYKNKLLVHLPPDLKHFKHQFRGILAWRAIGVYRDAYRSKNLN